MMRGLKGPPRGGARLGDVLGCLGEIRIPAGAPPVSATIAAEVRERFAPGARGGGVLEVSVAGGRGAWAGLRPLRDGGLRLEASQARHLYAFFSWLVETRLDRPVAELAGRRLLAFEGERPVWDLYFAQAARSVRGMDAERYVREMARLGFTHLEINSLATREGREEGVPGEVYPRFYTYCPALDQFVESFLNRGTYPRSFLDANLRRLRRNAALAARYGLVPAMTVFEPRSVPESLLSRYPELRGARVDHPFRSFRPRYTLAVSHPEVRAHYREMVCLLLDEVPDLGLLSVWTNDSGAGFEFTRSLYAGANGSAYLVREWSDPEIIARSAAENVLHFLRLIRDAAAERNPAFRVATRLEPFLEEREQVVAGLGHGLDAEVPSLSGRGWECPYGHPRYRDSTIGPFTVLNNRFLPRERAAIRRLERRAARVHVMHAHGPVNNFEPLLGIPTPWLVHEKLAALHRAGARHLAHLGGLAPPGAAPWSVNEEVFRRFQFDPSLGIDEEVKAIARAWAGERRAAALARAWRLVDRAVRGFMPDPLYFSWGVWYRILVRPLVPDIEAIPERERRYYERHLLATHHNPNRIDLGRDVLFTLMTPAVARRAVPRIDRNALPPLDRAIATLDRAGLRHPVLRDQHDRLRALRCWFFTHRNVALWIAEVHGSLRAEGPPQRAACRSRLREMVPLEIENTRALLRLWERSPVTFMAVSGGRETTFIYGANFGGHLRRKISLMQRYGGLLPRIDPGVMWRVAGLWRR